MPGFHFSLSLIVVCALLMAFAVPRSESASSTSPVILRDTQGASMLPSGQNGSALLDKLLSRSAGLGDYKFDASLDTLKENNDIKVTATFYIKPPTGLRVDVIDYGSKSGAIMVRRLDGSIRAKGGPAMWGIKMTLSRNSRLLMLPNGLNVLDSDLSSLLRRLKAQQASGDVLVSSVAPSTVQSLNKPVLLLECQLPKASGGTVTDRLFVDPVQNLVLQWDLFDNGAFKSRSRFDNYQINTHFDASQFDL